MKGWYSFFIAAAIIAFGFALAVGAGQAAFLFIGTLGGLLVTIGVIYLFFYIASLVFVDRRNKAWRAK